MTTVCSICARGGSKGVPGKNIKELHGKPLIAHTIAQALASPEIDHVYVSTDDPEIAEVAKRHGATVPFLRPQELATDKAGKLDAIIHLIEFVEASGIEITRVIDLDPTSPLRLDEDITNAAALLDEDTDAVITGYPCDKNPYFNMVEQKSDGNYRLVCQSAGRVLSRQAAPDVYAMNASIYVWHRHTLEKGIWEGNVRLYAMPHERSVDIDMPLDFKIVELLMNERSNENV